MLASIFILVLFASLIKSIFTNFKFSLKNLMYILWAFTRYKNLFAIVRHHLLQDCGRQLLISISIRTNEDQTDSCTTSSDYSSTEGEAGDERRPQTPTTPHLMEDNQIILPETPREFIIPATPTPTPTRSEKQ